MPIAALPPTTVRAIGSTSIISDPCSIIKELLDNALDASASSVSIEISQDTVGLIQVKDNGHGIPQTDYALVGKRAFTSKIHTIDDLRNVGGKSLGFRGEALASAAEVSGSLTVATRVEAEPVGSSLKYGRNGELISAVHVPHPVGTTVRISNLFKHIPVRRQTAIKNSKKSMLKTRKMIQAYSMARPSTRLSFKVLKVKSESSNWMYAPGRDATLMEAALKAAGTEIASNCILKEWPPLPENANVQNEGGLDFRVVALLPKLGADFTKFNNSGQYISIDGRPVAAGRGIAKDIAKLYKSYLRSVMSHNPSPTITDPFVCFHIRCPEGCYDVNVEPSKDDVLFEDQQVVLSVVEDLLRDTYGETPGAHASKHGQAGQEAETPRRNGSEALLTGRSNEPNSLSHPRGASFQAEGFASAGSFVRPKPRRAGTVGRQSDISPSTRSGDFSELDTIPLADASDREEHGPRLRNGRTSGLLPRRDRSPTISRNARQASSGRTCFPSPVSSMGSPSDAASRSPVFSRASALTLGLSQMSPMTPVQSGPRQQQREHDRERYGNGSLDTWFLKLNQAAPSPEGTGGLTEQDSELSLSQLTQQRFGSDEVSPNGATGVESSRSQPVGAVLNLSPGVESSQGPSHISNSTAEPMNKRQDVPVLEQWSAILYNASNPNHNPELQKALEFENRKKAAIQERRMQMKSVASSGSANSPHLSRYLAARAALNTDPEPGTRHSGPEGPTGSQASKPVLSPHDPRAYLMRFQGNQHTEVQNNSKLKRILSSKLPFEKIPDGHNLHDVGLKWPAELPLVYASFKQISKTDLYTRSSNQIEIFTSPDISAALDLWRDQLSALTRARYRLRDTSDIPDLQFEFSGITQLSDNFADGTTTL
ncbi:hypothetical protein BDW59DRAFT_139908 [Aspergillus cavernicola]|uniref:DNA mismatch repair protein S5 domain-containing protein n=1 Tax=Aspergillus cavernicola TaxID=176166 RepID=A0ABR4IVE1_9EURO